MRAFAVAGFVVVASLAASALAAGTSVNLPAGKVIIPATSPVSHPKITETHEAEFAGKFAVTGTLSVDYSPGGMFLRFEPDAADAARLPYVADDHKVGWLVFEDADNARLVAAALPPATLAMLAAHHDKRAQVHLTVDAEHYAVAVQECTGEGWYTAHLIAMRTPGAVKIVAAPPPNEGEDC